MKLHGTISFIFLLTALLSGCASPGNPDGGPYDETAPKVVGSSPQYAQLNSTKKKVEIFFNEFVRLENASEKVVVSPPQLNMPDISSSGKKITVELEDSLKKNTTYTVDFSDAIVDNNEGNPLGNYTFVFSTGEKADSMEVSGRVLNAQNLEPIKGILVGLHSDTTDTAFLKTPFLRVARTNSAGDFIIKGVAPGKYRAYALQDADGTFTFSQKSEMIAFTRKPFETGSFPDARPDTVWRDSTHIDSVRIVHFTHYTPDNMVLLAFLESHQERHLLKTERSVPDHFEVYFTAPSDVTPKLKGLNFKSEGAFALNRSVGNDTLSYWIKDTTLIHQDTLTAAYTFLETDSTGTLVERTDTINFISKISHAKQLKWQAESERKWQKEQDKLKKKGLPYQTKMPDTPLDLNFVGSTTIAPDENLTFETKEPIAEIDTSHIHLLLRKDSVYLPAPYILKQHSLSLFRATIFSEWRPKQEYKLLIDSGAVKGIYGHLSKNQQFTVNVPSLDTYSSLFLNLIGVTDSSAIVELLDNSDKVVRRVRSNNGRAEFFFVKPSHYYVRLFIDKNGNGIWDPGDYQHGIMPEETYYYPTQLNLRALWDVEQDWDIHALPLTRQKPIQVTKQKPDKEKSIKKRNAERERNKH
jgi:uncharacterized protein (DUF2141 family)